MSIDHVVDEKVLPLLAAIEADPARPIAEFSRVVGRVLNQHPDTGSLRHLRSELSAVADRIRGEHGVADDTQETRTAAVVEGFAHVLAGYVDQAETAMEAAEVAHPSPLREQILQQLMGGPLRPSEIADLLGRRRTQISHALGLLGEAELVAVEGSELDGRARQYRLTHRGRALVSA